MYCHKCGREIRNGVLFCPKCGTKLKIRGRTVAEPLYELAPFQPARVEDSSLSEQVEELHLTEQTEDNVAPDEVREAYESEQIEEHQLPEQVEEQIPNESSTGRKVLWLLVMLLLMVGTGAIAYFSEHPISIPKNTKTATEAASLPDVGPNSVQTGVETVPESTEAPMGQLDMSNYVSVIFDGTNGSGTAAIDGDLWWPLIVSTAKELQIDDQNEQQILNWLRLEYDNLWDNLSSFAEQVEENTGVKLSTTETMTAAVLWAVLEPEMELAVEPNKDLANGDSVSLKWKKTVFSEKVNVIRELYHTEIVFGKGNFIVEGLNEITSEGKTYYSAPKKISSKATATGKCGVNGGSNATWTYYAAEKTLVISGTGGTDWYGNGEIPWEKYCPEINTAIVEEGITSLGGFTFIWTGIKKLYLPSTLKQMQGYEVNGVDELTAVYYNGTIRSWRTVSKSSTYGTPWDHEKAQYGPVSYQVCCTDGKLEVKDEVDYSCGSNTTWSYDAKTDTLTFSGQGAITEDYCFGYVKQLGKNQYEYHFKKIVFDEGITAIEIFIDDPADTVVLPASLTEWYEARFMLDTDPPKFEIADGSPFKYDSAHRCLIDTRTKKLLMAWPGATIPDDGSVEIIGSCAFNWLGGYDKRTSFTIPVTVKKVEHYAFVYYDSLKELIFLSPDTIIDDDNETISSQDHSVGLAGYASSTAEAWAKKHGRNFRVIK